MKRTAKYTALGLLAAFGTTAIAPAAVLADNDASRQQNKNLMRDLAIGGAVLGGYGLLNHNNGLALLGVAGAAVAGSQYEKDRHNQSVDQSRDDYRDYHRNGGDYEYHNGNRYRSYDSYTGNSDNASGWQHRQDSGR